MLCPVHTVPRHINIHDIPAQHVQLITVPLNVWAALPIAVHLTTAGNSSGNLHAAATYETDMVAYITLVTNRAATTYTCIQLDLQPLIL